MPHADLFYKEARREQLNRNKQATIPKVKNSTAPVVSTRAVTPKMNISKLSTEEEIRKLRFEISALAAQTTAQQRSAPTLQASPTPTAVQMPAQKATNFQAPSLPLARQRFTQFPTLQASKPAAYQAFQQPTQAGANTAYSTPAPTPAPSRGDLSANPTKESTYSLAGYQSQRSPNERSRYWDGWMGSALEQTKPKKLSWQDEDSPTEPTKKQNALPQMKKSQFDFENIPAYEGMRPEDAKRQFLSDWLDRSMEQDTKPQPRTLFDGNPQKVADYSAIWNAYQRSKEDDGRRAKDFDGFSWLDTKNGTPYNFGVTTSSQSNQNNLFQDNGTAANNNSIQPLSYIPPQNLNGEIVYSGLEEYMHDDAWWYDQVDKAEQMKRIMEASTAMPDGTSVPSVANTIYSATQNDFVLNALSKVLSKMGQSPDSLSSLQNVKDAERVMMSMHPVAALKINDASRTASAVKAICFNKETFPNVDIDGASPNAFLHTYWAALSTAYGVAPETAEQFLTAHETLSKQQYEEGFLDNLADPGVTSLTGRQNVAMDLHNNNLGIQIGTTIKEGIPLFNSQKAIHKELLALYGTEEQIKKELVSCQDQLSTDFGELELLVLKYVLNSMKDGDVVWLHPADNDDIYGP